MLCFIVCADDECVQQTIGGAVCHSDRHVPRRRVLKRGNRTKKQKLRRLVKLEKVCMHAQCSMQVLGMTLSEPGAMCVPQG